MSRIRLTKIHSIGTYLVLLMTALSSTYSQQHFRIEGKVVDPSREPLAFSTVSLLGSSAGVVTNFLREFEMEIDKSQLEDTLYVSMLGYEPVRVATKSLDLDQKQIFILRERIVLLEEVEINEKKLTASEIVDRVLDKISENYPYQPYLLEGFTRSHKQECGAYVTLYEADFSLYGQGYHKKIPEKIYVNASRQSSYVPYHHSRVLRNNRNLFISMRHINDVLFRSYSLQKSHNTYEIANYTIENDQLIYVIKTNHSKYVEHTMYINADDYALLKVVMEMNTPEDEEWNPLLNKGPSSDSLDFKVTRISKTIQFEKTQSRYFSKYMDWLVEGKLYLRDTDSEFCDWGFRFETMYHKVQTENIEKPSKEKWMNPKSKKDPSPTPYDPLFWQEYPPIKTFPVSPQIVRDLEKSGPLEEQFESQSHK